MDELVLLFPLAGGVVWGCETAEEIDHVASGRGADPDVAVYDPQYISLCFSIAPAHIPDLRIWPKVVDLPIMAREIWVFLLYQYLSVKAWKVME